VRTLFAYLGHRTLVCSSLLTFSQSRWERLQRQCRTSAAASRETREGIAAISGHGQASGPLVMDAALAAIAIEHDATLCTTDRDSRSDLDEPHRLRQPPA